MKNLFLLLLLPLNAMAFEWEAGIREVFITKDSYTYNSDSSARVLREVMDKGYQRISIHPRIQYTGDNRSMFILPSVKSSTEDLSIMAARVAQADGSLTVKPIVFDSPSFGEAKPLGKINPLRPALAIKSYYQQMTVFLQVVRKNDVARFVVGNGISHLLEDEKNLPEIEKLFKGLKNSLSPATELIFEIQGNEELEYLASALSRNFSLAGLIDGIAFVPDSNDLSADSLRHARVQLEGIMPSVPVHLSRVIVPACDNTTVIGGELYCTTNVPDWKVQKEKLLQLKKVLLSLEKDGVNFKSVEIIEGNTDFEPKNPDPRYPYYNPLMRTPAVYELPAYPLTLLPPYPIAERTGKKNACVLYDKNDIPPMVDRIGDIHSVMLESLIGAFPAWKVTRSPIKSYFPGSLQNCQAVFYMATNFSQEIPAEFAVEMASLTNHIPVVWFNYKSSAIIEALKGLGKDPGFDVPYIMQPDTVPTETNTDPGFFRYFDYKGETFLKMAEWNHGSNNFASSAELSRIEVKNNQIVDVLSVARHSKTNATTPYAVRSGNLWYIADTPMSFLHYEDRFFIFADLLWDIFEEKAPEEKIALVRFEDINPYLDLNDLRASMDYLGSKKVPFSLAVIPWYSDRFTAQENGNPVFKSMTKFPDFISQLRHGMRQGGSIIMHGTAHAVGDIISGYDGNSGSDYEFWLYPENTPLPFDSVNWLTNRLEMGIKAFQEVNITPVAFEAPHYAASAMNFMVFAKMFRWNYHRTIYFPHSIKKDTALPERLRGFDCLPKKCGDERRAILNNIKIDADFTNFGGLIAPYIIHKDAYGQSLIPETLGMVDFAFYDPKTWRPVSKPEDIIRRAKKLKVIRGAIASFFWHPLLLSRSHRYYLEVPGSYEKIGGLNSLKLVIEGIQKLGYTFKSIEDREYFPEEEIQ